MSESHISHDAAFEQKHVEDLERIRGFRLMDDDFMSKVFEDKSPKALPGETQKWVNIWFGIYTIVYGIFDKIIHVLDSDAYKVNTFPNWFMTIVSLYGLGFQLLIIAVMLPLGWIEVIVPFFIAYSVFIFVLIGIRKIYLK